MIENIPAGWIKGFLNDEKTNNINSQNINKFNGNKNYLSTKSIKKNKIHKIEEIITYENKPSRANLQPIKNSVIFAKMQYTEKVLKITEEMQKNCIFSTGFMAINPVKDKLNSGFLEHYFKTTIFNLQKNKLCNGGTQKALSNKNANKIFIPIPPIKQQQKIVKVLDITTNLITQQQELLKQYDLFLKSKFIEMFGDPVKNPMGWEIEKLVNLSINNGEYGSSASAIKYNNKKPRYIRITDITNEGCLKSDKKSPSSVDVKYLLNKGDIVFARSGATVGKTYLHNLDNANFQFAGYLIRFIPNKKLVNPIFLFYFTKSNYYNTWLNSKQKVVAQPNINAKEYGSLDIFLPTITLQNKFADIVEKIENIKTQQNKKLLQLQDLHNSLMQKAFKGEIK
jgi:type I restriction enzyme S subunit